MADINPAIKKMQKLTFQKIECNKKLYLDRNFEILTLESIKKDIEQGKQATLPEPYTLNNLIKVKTNFMGNNIFKNNASKIKTRLLYYQSAKSIIKKEFINKEFNFKENNSPDDEFIEISLPKYIETQEIEKTSKFSFLSGFACCGSRNQSMPSPNQKNAIIIHIHGGGFVATSSCTHQSYSRIWANQLKIPILSIDYRLSPEYQYPAAFDDCWQVYCWLEIQIYLFLVDFTPQKIYLVGDSCGGTLAINICFQAIMKQIKLPDGLFFAYPALNLNSNSFTPSYLYSINDQLIPSKLLKIVLQAYIPEKLNHNVDKDFFLTPLHASDTVFYFYIKFLFQFFEKLPPIQMIAGERDPLSDDSMRLVQKQQNLNKHIKLIIYKYLPHGFLNFGIPVKGFQFSRNCIDDSIEQIKQIINLAKEI